VTQGGSWGIAKGSAVPSDAYLVSYIGSAGKEIWQVPAAAINDALAALQIAPSLWPAVAAQLDVGSGKQQATVKGGLLGFFTGLIGATPTTNRPSATNIEFTPSANPSEPASSTNQPTVTATDSSGNPVSTAPSGDVQSVGASTPAASLFGFLASLGFWKGIGLVLAGVLIIVFGALELRKLA
jgi:hypothetical protein